MSKRLIALTLTLALIFSCVPAVAFAAGVTATLNVADVYAVPGATVAVPVKIEDNPGILGATLTVSWDEGLTLVDSTNGAAFAELTYQPPSRYVNGCNFVWYASAVKDIIDGEILILTFEVPANAAEAQVYDITITYDRQDIYDVNYDNVELSVNDGSVRILTYKPGDVTDDDRVNPLDLIKLSQYISDGNKTDPDGFNVSINVDAANVNLDTRINPLDLIWISQYISDGCKTDPAGFNRELFPAPILCTHDGMQATSAKAPTCTEEGNIDYWYCSECEKYFSNETGTTEITLENTVIDALGHQPGAEPTCTDAQTCTKCGAVLKVANNHTEVSVPGYAATTEKEGLTDGIKCSVCGEWVVEQTVIEKLQPKEHTITYFLAAGDYIDQGDAYLQKQVIENPNPTTYKESEMVILQPLSSPGYTFDGWVDQHGTRWDVIPKGSTQELVLYAKWTQNVYTVTFDTPDVDVFTTYGGEDLKNKAKYTIDTGLTLTNPTAYKYTFVGWSNDDGFIVSEIKPGTAENITLRANWTSDRNRATSYADYGDPIIIEDNERKQFLFVYNIGKSTTFRCIHISERMVTRLCTKILPLIL